MRFQSASRALNSLCVNERLRQTEKGERERGGGRGGERQTDRQTDRQRERE